MPIPDIYKYLDTLPIESKEWNRLGENSSSDIRKAVARHPGCPTRVRDKLWGDPDPSVRALAVEHTKNMFNFVKSEAAE